MQVDDPSSPGLGRAVQLYASRSGCNPFMAPLQTEARVILCFGAKENEQILDRRGDNVYGYKAEMKLKTADSALFNIEVYNSSMTPKARR